MDLSTLNTPCQECLNKLEKIPTVFRFTDHVPPGMHPCFNCCYEGVDEWMPGQIHEWPEDGERIRIQHCHFCAGTGVCLPADIYSSDEYHHLEQFKRARSRLEAHAEELYKEYAWGLALLLSKRLHETVAALDEGLINVESLERLGFEEALAPLDMLATLLRKDCSRQELRHFLGQYGGTIEGLVIINQRLHEWWAAVSPMLPALDSAEEHVMHEWLKPLVHALEVEYDRSTTRYHAPLLWEELAAVLIIYDKWKWAGCPKGTYAEQVVHDTLRKITPPTRTTVFTADELASFVYQQMPTEFAGLTPQLLAELNAAVKELGESEEGGRRRRIIIHKSGRCIGITASGQSNIRRMMVMGAEIVEMGHMSIWKPQNGDMQHALMWDRRVSAEDIRGVLDLLDEESTKTNLESVFGTRPRPEGLMKQVFFPAQPESQARSTGYQVSVSFEDPLTILMVVPGGPDAESLRQQFDHPELLAVHVNPFGATVLCLIASLPLLHHRDEAMKKILEKRGITSEGIAKLSFQEIATLRGEIRAELHQTHSD